MKRKERSTKEDGYDRIHNNSRNTLIPESVGNRLTSNNFKDPDAEGYETTLSRIKYEETPEDIERTISNQFQPDSLGPVGGGGVIRTKEERIMTLKKIVKLLEEEIEAENRS